MKQLYEFEMIQSAASAKTASNTFSLAWARPILRGALGLACLLLPAATWAQQPHTPTSQMERIDRGGVALPAQDGKGIFLSWRLLGTDRPTACFDVERDGKIVAHQLRATSYTDPNGSAASRYRIFTYQQPPVADGKAYREVSNVIVPWTDLYRSLPVSRPEGGTALDGRAYTYSPNDCSVGDVDGDGEYELIVKWDPSNSHDNSHNGYTGEVFIDCYKMDGKLLWRVGLGRNIRAGAHYTQFLVYDFDGDGKAEMICKTAPGSKDGKGRFVSSAATEKAIRQTDNLANYSNDKGRIMKGPEFLTVFNGQTGKALHTVWYNPNRGFGVGGSVEYATEWGDKGNYGNRGERYLACVAYLKGADQNPSAVMCRGYYTRSYLWAVDFDGKHLSTRWLHASTSPSDYTVTDAKGRVVRKEQGLHTKVKGLAPEDKGTSATAYGQGAHNISVADVDGDGCDEITYGSAAIDQDGSLLYSTGLGHGDAQHLADLVPDRPGLEFYMVHESYPYGSDLRDARTGEILYRHLGKEDTGRGLAADIDARYRGAEFWCLDSRAVRNAQGDSISNQMPAVNFRIYWDGDLQEELLANGGAPHFPPYLQKWNGQKAVPLPLSNGKHLRDMGHSVSNNWSKATPNLQADILGDWREELIFWDESDGSHLNIFTTNAPTDYRVPTLMHDHVYRMGVAWQNVGYNQPPHLGYYLPDYAEKVK